VPDVETSGLELLRFPGGEKVPLATFRGQVVLLDLWATWCAPCVEALPAYRELEQRYADQGLVFLALSLDEDPRQVQRFLEEQQLTLNHLFLDGPDQPVASALKLRGLPTTYLLDRQGRLRHVHEGFLPEELPELVSVLEALLSEQG
jgi:thiol-disulfide isomerase/thioredoxin